MTLHRIAPPKNSIFSLKQIHAHKLHPGDIVAYYFLTERGGRRSFQLSEVEILAPLYDDCRIPRYKIRIIKRVTIKDGVVKKSGNSKRQNPTAYAIERNQFPREDWDEQIRRKCNLTRLR